MKYLRFVKRASPPDSPRKPTLGNLNSCNLMHCYLLASLSLIKLSTSGEVMGSFIPMVDPFFRRLKTEGENW